MSRGEVVKAGYLTKSPPEGRVAQWHRRWFVFSDSHKVYPLAERYVRMEYYHSEEDAKKLRNPKGIIDLQQCLKVTNRENMRGFRHVFDVCTAERTYHLAAESPTDKHDWMDTLNTTLFTSSHTPRHTPQPPQHPKLTTSYSHNPSSQPHTQHPSQPHHQNVRSAGAQPPVRRSPDSSSVTSPMQALPRPLSYSGDPSANSRQNLRPLPPVPGNTGVKRPLPPTPPNHAPSPVATHYKRPSNQPKLPHQSSLRPPASRSQHTVIRQTKSNSCLPEAPDCYHLSSSSAPLHDRDYVNLDSDPSVETRHSPPAPSSLPHSSQDYANLDYDDVTTNDQDYDDVTAKDQDYDDVTTHDQDYDDVAVESPDVYGDACVYEDYVPRPAPISTPQQAPISRPQAKGPTKSRSAGYVNVENSATISDDYSVLEPVHPQPPTGPQGGEDYSRLDLSGHLDLGSSHLHSAQNGSRPHNKDYENLAHVPHPDPGDYSNLHY